MMMMVMMMVVVLLLLLLLMMMNRIMTIHVLILLKIADNDHNNYKVANDVVHAIAMLPMMLCMQ